MIKQRYLSLIPHPSFEVIAPNKASTSGNFDIICWLEPFKYILTRLFQSVIQIALLIHNYHSFHLLRSLSSACCWLHLTQLAIVRYHILNFYCAPTTLVFPAQIVLLVSGRLDLASCLLSTFAVPNWFACSISEVAEKVETTEDILYWIDLSEHFSYLQGNSYIWKHAILCLNLMAYRILFLLMCAAILIVLPEDIRPCHYM